MCIDHKLSSAAAAAADSFTGEHYGRAAVVFDGYEVGPSIKDCTHQRRIGKLNLKKVNITEVTKFAG